MSHPQDFMERNCREISYVEIINNKYKLSFFPFTIREWNSLEKSVKDSKSMSIFKDKILNKIRPKRKEYFGINDKTKTRYITLLRMGLSP